MVITVCPECGEAMDFEEVQDHLKDWSNSGSAYRLPSGKQIGTTKYFKVYYCDCGEFIMQDGELVPWNRK